MKRLLSGVLSLCLTISVVSAFNENNVVSASYLDDLNECYKYYKYQVRYDYEENGVKFTHEYRVFEKEDIEKLNVLPGYLSCNITEYTPETAPYEVMEEKIDEYNKIIEKINTPSLIYVSVTFYDENGNKVHYDGAKTIEEAEEIVANYDGEYATYEFGKYVSGIVPDLPKPPNTLSDVKYTDYVVEYYNETGYKIAEVIDNMIFDFTNNDILNALISSPVSSYQDAVGYRIAFCDDYSAYHNLYLTNSDNNAQSPSNNSVADFDGNDKVELTDLTAFSLYMVGDTEWTDEQIKNFDCNADGKTDLADLAHLKQYIMGEDVKLG